MTRFSRYANRRVGENLICHAMIGKQPVARCETDPDVPFLLDDLLLRKVDIRQHGIPLSPFVAGARIAMASRSYHPRKLVSRRATTVPLIVTSSIRVPTTFVAGVIDVRSWAHTNVVSVSNPFEV